MSTDADLSDVSILELFILFIYDTQRCQKEDDDPSAAVLYFHPTWVSEHQKLALCGQLMGATQFFLSTFSCPRVISLNSGKFVVQQFGRYILTVGSDRNIPDWILQHRADTLHSLMQFYHKDFDTILSKCSEEGDSFSMKLQQIFEVYVPIIQFAGNIFGTIPTVKLPKSAGSVFLEALQILQCFQAKGVLGGTVLYQNKVVATQLSSDLTKRLVSTDPYRLKSTAESVVTPFHLPVGVQLLYVYVPNSEYKKLACDASNAKSALQHGPLQKTPQRKIYSGKTTAGKEQMAMKRDTSRIFTVPEEEGESEDAQSENIVCAIVETQISKIGPDLEAVSEVDIANKVDEVDKTSKINETDSLSKEEEVNSGLKFDEIESGHKAEEVPAMDFSRNSEIKTVTPLDDVNINRVLHAKVLSICCEGESDSKKGGTKNVSKKQTKKMKSFLRGNRSGFKPTTGIEHEGQSSSLNDLHRSSRSLPKVIPLRCYSFGLPQLTREMCEEHIDKEEEKVTVDKYFFNTIADPLHPCFRNDGLPISRSLFHDYVANHYHLLKKERSVDTSPMENNSGSFQSISETEGHSTSSVGQDESKIVSKTSSTSNSQADSHEKDAVSFKQEVYRRSLSLPLKSTTTDGNVNNTNENELAANGCKSSWDKFGDLDSPIARTKQCSNLQLTPLMSKLSILAMEEKTSLPYSRETTPCDVREMYIPGRNGENRPSRRPSVTRNEGNDANSTKAKTLVPDTEKTVLYVCGQQNMALLLLLDEKLGQDPELIHFLWEISLSGLTQLESHIHHSLEHLSQGDGMEPYSYICLDPNWDMLQRGGSWGALELDVVSCLHNDFSSSPSLTEVVLRCDESTVYGYQCGRTEVFYQQPVGSTPGLPTPADLMGTVPLKAKRRLERDHGIILL